VVLALGAGVSEPGLLEEAAAAVVEEGGGDLLAGGVLRVRLDDPAAGLRDQVQRAAERNL
jgi:hypothetical protein